MCSPTLRSLLCIALLTAGASASADNAVPATAAPCLVKTNAQQTPEQQREQLKQTWRRHCALTDAEKADDEYEMKENERPQDEATKRLDELLGARRALDSAEPPPVDTITAAGHGYGDRNHWPQGGAPGSVLDYANPPYADEERHRQLLRQGADGASLPAVPEPGEAGMLLAGLGLLAGIGAYRRRQHLKKISGDTAPPAARQ
ncbi:hypothetical protein GTP45_00330 [Pseudoduganella sp. FT55W]|uniref:PEP-CTERM sorting domain-containing protein n=1 Tax=Duganella rivi TaxID=2666083 RepID=A0A7X4GKR8_9BURK|nr:hypothetical protein [Duganella rivi]MYM65277.1 hypothetical protein [Duganella rivi]